MDYKQIFARPIPKTPESVWFHRQNMLPCVTDICAE